MTDERQNSQVDRMLLQTRYHHIQLSEMADSKASMLMIVATLCIPASAFLITNPKLAWPSTIVIIGCVLTLLFAAYSSMPKIKLIVGNEALRSTGHRQRIERREPTPAIGSQHQDLVSRVGDREVGVFVPVEVRRDGRDGKRSLREANLAVQRPVPLAAQ